MSNDNRRSVLPDHIFVSRLKDVFWNNNSDLYPTNIPDSSLYDKIEKTRPIFHTPYSGICVLEGDYNHALYNGKYYFLKKLDPIDLTNNTYKYQLDEDIVINLLKSGCNITGTLIRTNREDILKECLQTCVPILNNPTEQTILNFNKNKTKTWQDTVNINSLSLVTYLLKINSYAFTKRDLQDFKLVLNFDGKQILKKSWKTNIDNNITYNTSDPLFLVATTPPSLTIGYEYHVVLNLIKFLDDFKNPSERSKFTLRKINIEGSDYLSGKFCITYNDDTGLAGTEEGSVRVSKLDFSNITEVEAINLSSPTPYELQPSTKIPDDNIFSIRQNRLFKLCRNPNLPLVNNTTPETARNLICQLFEAVGTHDTFDFMNFCRETTYSGNPPQIIEVDDVNSSKGLLYYVNRLDFALVKGFKDWYDTNYDKPLTRVFYDFGCPDRAWDYVYDYWWRKDDNQLKSNILPLGLKFITFDTRAFDDFEYTQDTPIRALSYFNGVNNNLKNYINSNFNGSDIRSVTNNRFLNNLLLALDGVKFTSILPSKTKPRKEFDFDYYGYLSVFGANRRQDSYRYYASQFLKWDYTLSNKWYQPTKNRDYRKTIVDSLTKGSVILKDSVKKGDILFLNDDWSFKTSPQILYQIPANLESIDRESFDLTGDETFKTTIINLSYIQENFKPYLDYYRNKLTSLQKTQENEELIALCNNRITNLSVISNILSSNDTYYSIYRKYRKIHNPSYKKAFETYNAGAGGSWGRESLRNTILTMGDFFGTQTVEMPDNALVAYAYKNKIHIGFLTTSEYDFELSTQNNYIKSIDGRTKWRKKVTHIKYISTLDHNQQDLLTGKEEDIYSNIPPQFKINITQQDLLNKSKIHVFDIKGTDWYCVFSKGKIHLVVKDNKASCFETDTELELYSTTPKTDTSSTFSKINEKAMLVLYGKTRSLNTKFNINQQINIWARPIVIADVESISEYYQVKFEAEGDYINDWIQTFKEIKKGVKINTTEYESLKFQAEKNDIEFLQYQQLNELAINRQRTKSFRENQDLDHQFIDQSINTAVGLASGVTGLLMRSSNPVAAVGAGAAAVHKLQSGMTFLLRDYDKLKGRVAEDERMFMQENSVALMHRKQNYEHNVRRNKIQLNAITNTYIKPTINDAIIQKKFNELNNRSDFQLHIFSPNEQQNKKINHIYSTYGCECVSTKYEETPLLIQNNMEEGLYQFSELQPNALECQTTEDLFINNIVRSLFETGIKFKNTPHQATQDRSTKSIIETQKIVFDTTKIPEWTSQVWDSYVFRHHKKKVLETIKTYDKLGLTDDEYTANKDNIKYVRDKDDKLFKFINEIISKRREGTIGIADLDQDLIKQKELEKIQQQLNECLSQKADLEQTKQELERCKEELKSKTDDHTSELKQLNNELTAVRKNLQDKENEITRVTNEIARITDEKDRCYTENKTLKQETLKIPILEEELRKSDTEINKQKSEKTKLQQEIGTTKQQIAEKTREIETLKSQKQDLERQLRECLAKPTSPQQNNVRQLQNRIRDLTTQLKNKQREIDNLKVSGDCDLLKTFTNIPYSLNLQHANKLFIKLAEQMSEINKTNIEEETEKYPTIKTLLKTIQDLDFIHPIYAYQDAMALRGWSKYLDWKTTQSNKDGDVDEVIAVLEDVPDNTNTPTLHAIKAILDEVAFNAYKAKVIHGIKNKKDPDNPNKNVSDIDLDENIQYLLGTFINAWRNEYELVFDIDIEHAIKRKGFGEVNCAPGQALKQLETLNKNLVYRTDDIPTTQTPPDEYFINYYKNDTVFNDRPFTCNIGVTPSFIIKQPQKTHQILDTTSRWKTDTSYYLLRIKTETKDYYRYWSRRTSTGSKYFTYYETEFNSISYPEKTGNSLNKNFPTRDVNFYCHWSGQLPPSEFFDRRYAQWVSMIKQFENAISHEDMRDQIKRESKLEVKIQKAFLSQPVKKYKENYQLRILNTYLTIDLYKHFGKRDAYKALWILCVLSWNGLYMNKIWQGNDYYKFRIQPMWHPFHDLDKQEVINLMTKTFKKQPLTSFGIEFGLNNTIIEIIGCVLAGNYDVLKFPEVRNWLEGMNNVGYYEWTREDDADPNDYQN